ncbi:hypothetical protein Lal_00004352 [Lupinus albus]|uniref:Putative transcription factor MYB-HB-like family n=1 Tax=Lupinus albus TaxID=3870 RepID=A0A6A4NHD5_LUPAL|nr:putative transcription factor MYB-HB-like family [Lupinus albus]KAF1864979.1 hypothetical protein Lal_00004352 [Lupinus albus]
MGRAPCCDKANVKRGPWSPEEDAKLKSYIEKHGTGGNWIALPQKIGLKRCGKSCRLRWLNYLRPNIKHGGFTEEEDNIICSLYISIGSRWSVIAAQLPGRTDNDIKNYWNTRLKKKLLGKHRKEQQQARNSRSNGFVVKQESNRVSGDSSSSLVPQNGTQQQLYWPQMPVLPPSLQYTNQGPSFNDQESVRKLLAKLGGGFNDDYQPTFDEVLNPQFTNCPHPSSQQIYEEQVHIGSTSSSCMNSTSNNLVQFPQTNDQYCVEGASSGLDMVQVQGNLSGFEFFYGEDMFTDKIIGTTANCSQSTNWGESTSTVICPPLVANSNYRQETPKECVFQELRSYTGEQ